MVAKQQSPLDWVGPMYEDIPIIAMIANAMQRDKEKYLQTGMNEYLIKPVYGNALRLMFERFFEQYTHCLCLVSLIIYPFIFTSSPAAWVFNQPLTLRLIILCFCGNRARTTGKCICQ